MTASRAALLIAVVGGALRILIAIVAPVSDVTENMRVGVSLATSGEFANPFPEPTGKTAHVAPVFPMLIAASIRAAGSNEGGFKLARCVVILVVSVFIARLPWIATALGLSAATGVLAAATFASVGVLILAWMEVTGQHEGALTGAALAFLVATTVKLIRSGTGTSRQFLILGVAWGAAMHVSPTLLLPMAAVWLALLALNSHRRTVFRAAPAFILGFVVAVTPWIVRNYFAVGTPAFVRDNFGLELAMSHGPDATWHMTTNIVDGGSMSRHPYFSRDAALEMRRMGEAAFNRSKQEEALRWISEHPREFIAVTAKRTLYFFLPVWDARNRAWFYIPVLFLWVIGALLLWRTNRATCVALNAALLAFGLPHFLIQSSTRYSYPVLWILVLQGHHAVLFAWSGLAHRLRSRAFDSA